MKHLRSWLFLLAGLALAVRTQAQHQADPVTVPVDIVAQYTTDASTNPYNQAAFSVSPAGISVTGLPYPGMTGYPEARYDFKPGMAYSFYVSGIHIANWSLRIHPPAGYAVFIEDAERQLFSGTGSRNVKVRIAATTGLPAGAAADPRPGRILWSLGLGQLKNGDPAGEIQMRQIAITASCFQPAALYFDSDNPDVRIVKIGGVLRQVYANECLADIQAINSYSYWVRFYPRGQIGTQNPDGTWNVNANTEFASYKVENPVYPTVDRLKITRIDKVNGTRTSWTEIRKSGATWTVYPWNTGTYPAVPDSQTTVAYSDADKNETISVKTSGGTIQAQSFNQYKEYAWGRELYRTVAGYNATNPLQTTLEYHTTASLKGNYRQVSSRIAPDGNWERYEYYDDINRRSQIKRTYRPINDAPTLPTSATTTNCEVTDIDYAADFTGLYTLPSSIITTRGGIASGKTLIGYNNSSETRNGLPVVVATRDDYSNASSFLRTITRSYRADASATNGSGASIYPAVPNAAFYAGKPHSVIRPDNTMQVFAYIWGVFNPSNRAFTPVSGGTEFMIVSIEGTTSSAGNTACSNYLGYAIDGGSAPGFYLIPNKSTSSSTVFSAGGLPIYTQRSIYASGAWQAVSGRLTAYVQGLAAYPLWTIADAGYAYTNMEVFSADYNDGNLMTWSKNASGIETYYMYDSLGRQYGRVVSRVSGQPITTTNDETWSFVQYDAASRVTKSWTADAFNYPTPSSTDIVSTTAYDWAGRVTSATTPGVVGETFANYTSYNYYFHGGDPRTTRTVRPDGADVITTTYLDGRPKSVTGAGTAPTYFSYSVSSDGRLITERRLGATAQGDGWTQTYSDWLGRDSEQLRPTYAGGHTKFRSLYNALGQLTESQLFNQSWQALLAPTRYRYDTNGRLDRSGMDVDGGGLGDTGLDRVTDQSSVFESLEGAWWSKSTSKSLTNTANATDGVEEVVYTRLTGLYAAQTDGSRFTGESRTKDANGQFSVTKTFVDRTARKATVTTSVPGSSTTGSSIAINGLTVSSTSTSGVSTEQSYDGHRRPLRTSTRDSVYVELEYYPGTTLVKHRKNLTLGGSGYQQTYYDNAGRVSVERVCYDAAGLWKTSRFAYTTRGELWRTWGSAENPIEYVYNGYGQRTAMRAYRTTGVNWDSVSWPGAGQSYDETVWTIQGSTGLVTAKKDPKNATVSFTFNDRGQVASRTWARGVVTNYSYEDSAAYQTGDLLQVSYSDSTPWLVFSRNLGGSYAMRHGSPEAIFDGAGGRVIWYRPKDLQVTHEYLDQSFYGNSSGQYRTVVRTYDTLGRLSDFDTRWSGSPTPTFQSVNYRYDPVTGRVDRITGSRVTGASRAFDYSYRPDSDLVSAVVGADIGSGFRRDTDHQDWRSLVDTVETTWGGSGNIRAGFTYDYNRGEQRTGQQVYGDLATTLNYGSAIQNTYRPNARGEVDKAEAVRTDTGAQIPDRYRVWTYDAQGNRDLETRSPGSTDYVIGLANQYTSVGGLVRAYDADGNLKADRPFGTAGRWQYYWDGENRLTSVARDDGDFLRLDFTYDYMGRRVRKLVTRNGTVESDRRYVYDGWNIIQEIDAKNTGTAFAVVKTFTWGLDLSGTTQGAGGVGGLLAIHGTSSTDCLLPLYDANGNIHGLIDAFNGTMKAAYSFSAFGETLQAINVSGTAANDNAIRFASKWLDVETGLYDYNHRVYSPTDGRFISRDPIGENGGLNLYGYCGNDPVGRWDYLGHEPVSLTITTIARAVGLYKGLKKLFGGGGTPRSTDRTRARTWGAYDRFQHLRVSIDPANQEGKKPLALGALNLDEPIGAANSDTSGSDSSSTAAPLRRITVIIDDPNDPGNRANREASGERMREGARASAGADPDVIIIDAREKDYAKMLRDRGVRDGEIVRVIVVDHGLTTFEEWSALQSGEGVKTNAQQQLGNFPMSTDALVAIEEMLAEDADIVLAGCYVGTNPGYLEAVSKKMGGRTVYGPRDEYPYPEDLDVKTSGGVTTRTRAPVPPLATPESHPDLFECRP